MGTAGSAPRHTRALLTLSRSIFIPNLAKFAEIVTLNNGDGVGEILFPLVSRVGEFHLRIPGLMVTDGDQVDALHMIIDDSFNIGLFQDGIYCPHVPISFATAPFKESADYDPDFNVLLREQPAIQVAPIDAADDVATNPIPEDIAGSQAGLVIGLVVLALAVCAGVVAVAVVLKRKQSVSAAEDERSGTH